MKVDILEMTNFFTKAHSSFDEEWGIYAFSFDREDGVRINFCFSIHEFWVRCRIYANPETAFGRYNFEKCAEIRVVDMQNKRLEVVCSPNKDIFRLSLLDDAIACYSNTQFINSFNTP